MTVASNRSAAPVAMRSESVSTTISSTRSVARNVASIQWNSGRPLNARTFLFGTRSLWAFIGTSAATVGIPTVLSPP